MAAGEAAALTSDDYAAIMMLYSQYAAALDLGDGKGRYAVFTEDGLFASRYSDHEYEPAEQFLVSTGLEPHGRRHFCYSVVVKGTPEGADGLCFLLYLSKFDEHADGSVLHGEMMTYDDKLVRTPKGWRFSRRHVWPDGDPRSPYFDDGRRMPQLPLPFEQV